MIIDTVKIQQFEKLYVSRNFFLKTFAFIKDFSLHLGNDFKTHKEYIFGGQERTKENRKNS